MGGRRRSGLVAIGAVALALTGVVAAATSGDDRAAADVSPPIDGYPQRIGFERPSARLPARPGPLAATLFDNAFGTSRHLGVTSRGRLYELPVGPNVLSPDGRLLLTTEVDGDESRLALHDLATGDIRVFDDIGQSLLSSELRVAPYRLDSTAPVHWSPDGARVLARFRGGAKGTGGHARLLDLSSGELTDLGAGTPAGFLAPGAAVIVSAEPSGGVVVTTTDASTGARSRTALQLAGPWRADAGARPGAGVSPDGTLMLIDAAEEQGSAAALRLFSLSDGVELPARSINRWDGCAPAWLDGAPVLPTATRGYGGSLSAGAELVTASGSQSLVAVHHRMQSSCLQLTTDALRAGPHRSFLGTSTALWTWYWWQLLLGSLTLIVLGLVVRHVVRERRWRSAMRGT